MEKMKREMTIKLINVEDEKEKHDQNLQLRK
jgi:hypothetical protein